MEPIILATFLIIALPSAWMISELYDNRGLRRFLGVLAIAVSYFVAFVVGSLEQMHSNTYFGDATTKLIETTISELEAGNEDNVLFHLKQLQTAYHPSYETRSDYRELVNQYAEDLSTAPHNSKPNGQRPPSSANRER